ncbi:MAG: UDP-glucose 6-dehydrogenase (EC [uncultured Caballeronia sp.]|nr:MAG: UDP-glucose 6-dehydrogenase (EC [uncultured Caballeronia sp.]
MKLTIIGSGYVGLVTSTCLADIGNDVLCLDLDERKIAILNGGGVPDPRAGPAGGHCAQSCGRTPQLFHGCPGCSRTRRSAVHCGGHALR